MPREVAKEDFSRLRRAYHCWRGLSRNIHDMSVIHSVLHHEAPDVKTRRTFSSPTGEVGVHTADGRFGAQESAWTFPGLSADSFKRARAAAKIQSLISV